MIIGTSAKSNCLQLMIKHFGHLISYKLQLMEKNVGILGRPRVELGIEFILMAATVKFSGYLKKQPIIKVS